MTETVGMGGERGMGDEVEAERGPRDAGATPVGAGLPPDDRLRLTACKQRVFKCILYMYDANTCTHRFKP